MGVRSSLSTFLVLAVVVAAAGCELAADFDRSKIPTGLDGSMEAGFPEDDAGVDDAGPSDAAPPDAGLDGAIDAGVDASLDAGTDAAQDAGPDEDAGDEDGG